VQSKIASVPIAAALQERVAHAKLHAGKTTEGDPQKLVNHRLAGYFSDLAHHLAVFDAMLKSRRERLSELINIHMSMASNRLNQTMHQLTRFATTVVPEASGSSEGWTVTPVTRAPAGGLRKTRQRARQANSGLSPGIQVSSAGRVLQGRRQ
jgi:hypothetical protein